jgi:hypothetical protein
MSSKPVQISFEKGLGSATTSYEQLPFPCHPDCLKCQAATDASPSFKLDGLFLQQLPFPYNDPLLFVIPSVPRFPASQLSPTPKYVVLLKENHM